MTRYEVIFPNGDRAHTYDDAAAIVRAAAQLVTDAAQIGTPSALMIRGRFYTRDHRYTPAAVIEAEAARRPNQTTPDDGKE